MTEEQLDFLITEFRKECEDLIRANIKETFQIQYGELTMNEGETRVIHLGEAYWSPTVYEVILFEATDTDGVNVVDSITISNLTTGTFSLTTIRPCLIRWETALKTLKLDFWTDGPTAPQAVVTLTKRADGSFVRLLSGADPVYFSNYNYETNAVGIKLYTPQGTALTTGYYPPSAWSIDGQSGFTTVEAVTAALDQLQPEEGPVIIPATDFKTWIIPSALINGTAFTYIPPEHFVMGTVTGYINYVPVFRGIEFREDEFTPGSGIGSSITFLEAPAAGTLIVMYYVKAIES